MDAELRELRHADADACDGIVASLPYFFGDPDGVEDCERAVRTQRGFAAVQGRSVVGFLTMVQHPGASAEITWMAVHADHRRHGIGRLLVEGCASEMLAEGCRLLFVLTLGPSEPDDVDDGYSGTRDFYAAMGFIPLREFELHSWNSGAALVLARPL